MQEGVEAMMEDPAEEELAAAEEVPNLGEAVVVDMKTWLPKKDGRPDAKKSVLDGRAIRDGGSQGLELEQGSMNESFLVVLRW